MHATLRPNTLSRYVAVALVALGVLSGCWLAGPPPDDPDDASGSPVVATTSVPVPVVPPSGSPSVPPITITTLTGDPPAETLPTYEVEVVVPDARYPVTLAAAPDGRIFYSELATGWIRVLHSDLTLDEAPWANVSADFDIEWLPDAPGRIHHGGLTGIAFDPNFSENGFVYVVTQVPGEDGLPGHTLVIRYREQDGRGVEPTVLLDILASKFDNVYSLAFGPDGMLYVPSGYCCGRHPGPYGAIIRMRPDGEPPGDNPFGDPAEERFGEFAPLVWAKGIRNAYDIAFVPGTSYILAGDNGTEAHDEINLIMPGHDYGWPAHEGATDEPGITQPLVDYGDERVAPTGMAHYDGEVFPELRGRFLMCVVHRPGLYALQLEPDNPGRLVSVTRIAEDCTLDVLATPSGEIYFSDRYTIYRLSPAS